MMLSTMPRLKLQIPPQTYATGGAKFVSLSVTTASGCTANIVQLLSMNFPPIADFDFTLTCWGESTTFTDLSSAVGLSQLSSWAWDFGDGNTSTLQNPVHTYVSPANYTVSLTVTDTNDCYASISKVVGVYMSPTADFTAVDECEGTPTAFTDHSVANGLPIISWLWDFGDGNSSTLQHPVHLYAAPGMYNVVLTVVDQNACDDTYSDSVEVLANPVALFAADTACLQPRSQNIDLLPGIGARSDAVEGVLAVYPHLLDLCADTHQRQAGLQTVRISVLSE